MTAPKGHRPCKAKIYVGTFGVSCIYCTRPSGKAGSTGTSPKSPSRIQEPDLILKPHVYIFQDILQHCGTLFMTLHPRKRESWF